MILKLSFFKFHKRFASNFFIFLIYLSYFSINSQNDSIINPNKKNKSFVITAPWYEGFEDMSSNKWTQIQKGDQLEGWILAKNRSSVVYYHSDFSSKTMIDNFIISPLLDCSTLSDPVLKFSEMGNYQSYYSKHSVLYSNDFNGDNMVDANWIEIYEGKPKTEMNNVKLSIPNTTKAIAFRYEGNGSDTWQIDNISISEKATKPIMNVFLKSKYNSVNFDFEIENFVVGKTNDSLSDGYLQYILNKNKKVNIYSVEKLVIDSLSNGNHSIEFSLFDHSDNIIELKNNNNFIFSSFDGIANCGDQITIEQENNTSKIIQIYAKTDHNISVLVTGEVEVEWDFLEIIDSDGNIINEQRFGKFENTIFSSKNSLKIHIKNDKSNALGKLVFSFICNENQNTENL